MSDTSGRLTARGSQHTESAARDTIARLTEFLNSRIRPPELVCLLLVGAFGRGEGRICVSASGEEHPFGEIEFLLISANLAPPERAGLEHRLARDLAERPLPQGLSARLRVANLCQMRTAPCTVFWCDARFGHKLLLGDAGALLARDAFQPSALPPVAARDHVVQCGLPLLAAETGASEDGRARAMHIDEAILGCGNALLLLQGHYHWSLQERQCRMAERDDVPEHFRAAFQGACERSLRIDSAATQSDADAGVLPEMHLACERLRLRAPELEWAGYLERACKAMLKDLSHAPLTLAIRTIDPPVAVHPHGLRSWSARLGLRCAPRSEALALIHPAIAYDLDLPDVLSLASQVLDVWSGDRHDLRRAFVRAWILGQSQDVYAAVSQADAVLGHLPSAA